MPARVAIGQKWSVWSPSRRQWLLATVIGWESGSATLAFDTRYGMSGDDDKKTADEGTMLVESNLFRFVGP